MTPQPPYIQRIIPCECGSTEPYWHGPKTGTREYCCDACWAQLQAAFAAYQAGEEPRGMGPEHLFVPVQHQTGCATCGYARGQHPTARQLAETRR